MDIIRHALADMQCHNVVVSSTEGLITDYCTKVGAPVIVKGLRQNGDYEAELGEHAFHRVDRVVHGGELRLFVRRCGAAVIGVVRAKRRARCSTRRRANPTT